MPPQDDEEALGSVSVDKIEVERWVTRDESLL
jgi:hypothetical protein